MVKYLIIALTAIGIGYLVAKRKRAPKRTTKPGGADEPVKGPKRPIDYES